MDNKFDIIIIGSGLGGLICANILSKKGFKIAVLEKNAIPGGCLQTFKRKNVVFDTGIHYVGSFDEGQRLYKFYKYLGLIPGLKIRKLDPNGFDKIRIKDKEVVYASGQDNFIETLVKSYPNERKTITEFTRKVESISKSVALYKLEPGHLDAGSFFDKISHGSTWEYLTSLTQNTELQNTLSALNTLYAGQKEGSFLFMHALIYNHYIDSAYRFVDGSAQITNLLIKGLTDNGGQLITCEEVEEFVFTNKTISSLKTKAGNEYFANQVISAIHPQNTLKMIGENKIRNTYRNRINGIKNTTSSFSLYLVLKDKAVPYMNNNQYIFPTGNVWDGNKYNPKTWPSACALYPVADNRDQKYTRGISAITLMDFKEFEPWLNTSVEARGNDYKELKDKKSEQLINFIKLHMPEIGNNIEYSYAATPLTYRDYTGTPEGSIYGIERDFRKPLESFIFPKTKISNLFLTGQNVGLHGMLGVSMGALLTCGEVTDLDEILKEISNV
jgi:all-trans-retinol 13,14-reductase